jgi:hypothetical protein
MIRRLFEIISDDFVAVLYYWQPFEPFSLLGTVAAANALRTPHLSPRLHADSSKCTVKKRRNLQARQLFWPVGDPDLEQFYIAKR